jgi:hypothetical protein
LSLEQPSAPAAQRELHLESKWGFSKLESGGRSTLLAFPLPGAEDGPRDFLVYLRTPDVAGDVTIDPAAESAGRGFLIQTVGLLRGKTLLQSGTVRFEKLFAQRDRLRLIIDVQTSDASRIRGVAYISTDPAEVTQFQRRYARDVALLTSADGEPSNASGTPADQESRPTASREGEPPAAEALAPASAPSSSEPTSAPSG